MSKSSVSSETNLFRDASINNIPSSNGISNMTNIGFHTISTPFGLNGSPIINGLSSNKESHIILDYRGWNFEWSGVSFLFWINVENHEHDVPLLLLVICSTCINTYHSCKIYINMIRSFIRVLYIMYF